MLTSIALAAALTPIGTGSSEHVQLGDLPAGRPDAFVVSVDRAGSVRDLVLARHDLRAHGAVLRIGGSALHGAELPASRVYRGSVAGDPGSTVLARLADDGLHARVIEGGGETWSIRPTVRGHALRDEALPALACGSDALASGATITALTPPATAHAPSLARRPRLCTTLCEIAFDADYDYFLLKGSSVENVVDTIDDYMNQVDFYYTRDTRITYRITAYVVRTAPFYAPTSGGDLLDDFRAEWNANQTHIRRDIAHLMTDAPGSIIQYGGLAWVGVMCTSSGYGWSRDDPYALGHEIGHNWGAPHCLDQSPCNNMCGGCFYIAPNTKDVIAATRDSAPCLALVPTNPAQVPPYARPDGIEVRKDDYDSVSPIVFDVLGNDEDGNCERLVLHDFDAQSERGAQVALSPGTGPLGRDELEYSLPAEAFVGDDRFAYAVRDSGALSSDGSVSVRVLPVELEALFRFDETVGVAAADASGKGHTGTTSGGPLWTSGLFDGALELDGVNDHVALPPLDLDSDEITITAWVRRNGSQIPRAGIVFSRAASTYAGLQLGSANELRYAWNGASNTINFNSGLVVPDAQWVFVALTVEPTRASLYLHDGTLHSAVNPIAHAREAFDGETRIGHDANANNRRFRGRLDDVRIYDYALSAAEIAALVNGGRAEAPYPFDGAATPETNATLTWTFGPAAATHDVYFGTSYAAVRDATPLSPEYFGNQSGLAFAAGALASGTEYYWRIDEVLGTRTPGHVWQFRLAEFGRWKLDETAGSSALDSQGGDHGTYVGGVTLNRAGAAPWLGTAASFDGVNDRVDLPALALHTDRATITCWAKRNGNLNSFAGLVFSRAASTVAGLNVGDANELRYHWNGDSTTWGFDSGLVLPDGAWAFCAVVVEPTRATLYLGQNGVLASVTNAVSHGIEEFNGNAVIGRDPSGARFFRGALDDVRIYDAALTPAEVQRVFDGTL
ncbi:MAG: LamG-like jellyroll fold domain-containing protein [Planctomycetota bacterium]